jgi:hypothetical protein
MAYNVLLEKSLQSHYYYVDLRLRLYPFCEIFHRHHCILIVFLCCHQRSYYVDDPSLQRPRRCDELGRLRRCLSICREILTCLAGFDELHCIINYGRPIETLPCRWCELLTCLAGFSPNFLVARTHPCRRCEPVCEACQNLLCLCYT